MRTYSNALFGNSAVILILGGIFFASHVFGLNLLVPYTSQAPHGDWREPWQNACEESSIAMIDYYYANKEINPDIAANEITKIIRLKEKIFGWSLDENADTMTRIINDFMTWEAYIVENPTIEMITQQLDAGQPIIVPVHGKELYNPHLLNGGPVYHVLVLSGYDDETKEFIAQEPGTQYGKNYRYSYEVILAANHDFLPNNQTPNGAKKMIFTRKEILSSGMTDGDQDGLTKAEEIMYKTVPWLADSDGDGYSDGVEVAHGYSPISKNTTKVAGQGSVVKVAGNPAVYLLTQSGTRRHILNEQAFINSGYNWFDIVYISDGYLRTFALGEPIE